ncbi:MAG: NAD(P)-binding domain-containing protein [Alphaproteobacteria bacterium]|nr:NAD(P)-binding domain-containing protein [Alphaproteobacteria bacterium]MCB9693459.1 NAD(P)-binding domain-containing protein [Alphaproteobacteria bacterium]
MDIAIIGAGRVGSTLGRGLAAAGHTIHYARREPGPVPDRLAHERATAGSTEEVVGRSEVVLLATPWAAAEAAVSGVDFAGRALLDATNPIGPGMVLTHGHTDSGAEQVQRWAPTAKVVKVFNTTGMENMANPRYPTGASMMLACGDDADALATAVRLATDLGFDAHPFGALASARLLEPFAMVWIRLAMIHGHGRGFAFGMLRR